MFRPRTALLLWSLPFLLTAAAQDILSAIKDTATLSELSNFLSQTPDFASWLQSAEDITLLAPNNDGFKALLASTTNASAREDLLTYHVLDGVHGNFTSTDGILVISTARQSSERRRANITGGQVVLAQPQSNLNRTAFTSGLRQSVLTTRDAPIRFDAGVMHILDGSLTLPGSFNASVDSRGGNAFSEAVIGAPASRADGTGLDHLSNITVFLPIDYVWERIGNLVNDWTRDELDRVLSYHVIDGVLETDSEYPPPGEYTSFEGSKVTVSVVGDETYINNAKVIGSAPRIFEGGLIYSTYGVLNPDNKTLVGDEPNTSDVAFEGASMTANFSFPQPVQQSSDAAPPSSSSAGMGSTGLSTGAKAAIGVGVPAAVIIAGLLVAYLLFRRKAARRSRHGGTERGKGPWGGEASASQKELIQGAAAS